MKRKEKRLFIYIAFSLVIAICLFTLSIYDYVNADTPSNTYNNISGQFITASESQGVVDVECGFMPEYIYVVLPFSSGNTYAVYDASVSTTTSTWTIPMENRTYTITLGSTSGETGICEVNQNGFKFRCNAGNTRNVTCTYFARSGERVELLNVYINPVGVVSDSYNTVNNYVNYYDGATGGNKTNIINTFSSNLNVTDLYNTINFNGTLASEYYFYDDLYSNFPHYSGNNLNTYMALSYSDSENVFIVENVCSPGNVWILGNHVYSDQQFWMSRTHFIPHSNNVNGQNIITFEYDRTVYVDGSDGYSGGIWTTTSGQINGVVFSDIPIYFIGNSDSSSDHQDVQYLNNCIITNDDDDGFVVDRRLHQYTPVDPDGSNLNNNIGVMQGSFNVLYGGADLDNHKLLVAYNLNNYTSSIQNTVQLKVNYQLYVNGQYQNNEFLFDGDYNTSNNMFDSYDINNSNYVYIDMKSVFDKIYGEDTVAGDYGLNSIFQIINGTNFNQRFYTANEFLKTVNKIGGFSLEQRKNSDYYYSNSYWSNFFENIGDKAIDLLNSGFTEKAIKLTYNTSKEAVYDDAYLLVTMYLYNNANGDYSNSYIYKYNYLDGSVDTAGGFESEDEQFNGYYPTNNGGTGSYQSANNSAYGGSNNLELNVGLGSIPYLLVDIPENEWLNKTPNLKNILNDYKTMLAEVKDDSILQMMPATYSYLPAPLWQYITYGVGFLVMVGIWRAITRR